MLSSAVLLLTAAMAVGEAAEVKSPGSEVLKEFAQAVVGSWESEIVLVEDWPGIGKKGDKVAATSKSRWIAGKRALEGEWRAGDATGKWFTVWDPASKSIREFGVDSYGIVYETMITKEGDKWVARNKNVSPDGVKRSGTDTMTITDGGNSQLHEGSELLRDGQSLPAYRDVWKRAK